MNKKLQCLEIGSDDSFIQKNFIMNVKSLLRTLKAKSYDFLNVQLVIVTMVKTKMNQYIPTTNLMTHDTQLVISVY